MPLYIGSANVNLLWWVGILLPEKIGRNLTFWAKALRQELVVASGEWENYMGLSKSIKAANSTV